jgi:hypothetical protein
MIAEEILRLGQVDRLEVRESIGHPIVLAHQLVDRVDLALEVLDVRAHRVARLRVLLVCGQHVVAEVVQPERLADTIAGGPVAPVARVVPLLGERGRVVPDLEQLLEPELALEPIALGLQRVQGAARVVELLEQRAALTDQRVAMLVPRVGVDLGQRGLEDLALLRHRGARIAPRESLEPGELGRARERGIGELGQVGGREVVLGRRELLADRRPRLLELADQRAVRPDQAG